MAKQGMRASVVATVQARFAKVLKESLSDVTEVWRHDDLSLNEWHDIRRWLEDVAMSVAQAPDFHAALPGEER